MTHTNKPNKAVITYFVCSIASIGVGVNLVLHDSLGGITELASGLCAIGIGFLAYSAYLYGRLSERESRRLKGSHNPKPLPESHFW